MAHPKTGKTVLFLVILPILAASAAWLFLLTTTGSGLAVKWWVNRSVDARVVSVRRMTGSLATRFFLHDLEIEDFKGLPVPNRIQVQKLSFSIHPIRLWNSHLELRNGRLSFSGQEDPIVFFGRLKDGSLNLNVFSRGVGVKELLSLFPLTKDWKLVSGAVAHFDGYVKGTVRRPVFTGTFQVDRFSYERFSLQGAQVNFTLRLNSAARRPRLEGEVDFASGTIVSRDSTLQLEESRLLFVGSPNRPLLQVRGRSLIEGVGIFTSLEGTWQKPELRLVSEPPLSQDVLLLMLTTGRRWRNLEGGIGQGEIPLVLARDFVDYFIFSGFGTELSKRFGISSMSLTYDAQAQGVGLRGTLSDKMELNYGVERPQQDPFEDSQHPVQRLGAEYKLVEGISIQAEGEVQERPQEHGAAPKAESSLRREGRILLKYQTRF